MFLARAPFLRWQNPNKALIGINIMQPFGFGYPYTNGGNDATVMPDARLTKIRDTGFDFIRFAVDPEPLLTADSASNVTTTELDSRIAELMTGIGRRTALGIKLIVDIHFHGSAVSVSSGWQWTDVLDGVGGTKFTRLKFVAVRLATAIHAAIRTTCKPSEVCFELFNEPPFPSMISTASWITHLEAYFAAVRAVLPLHTIIVGGNMFNAIDGTPAGETSGLTALTASHFDANTGFAIHGYESFVFASQAVSGLIYQYMHGLTFPAASHPGGQSAAESAFTTAAGGDSNAINACVTQTGWASSIAQYFANYGSKAALAIRLAVATSWASSAGISNKRIFNTESGVNFAGSDDATDASAAAWVQAMRENAQEAGINCFTLHEAQGSNYGFQATSTPWAFNSSIQTALFPS